MKKLLLYALLMGCMVKGLAQADSVPAGAERYPMIPPFTLLKVDSTNLTREQLRKNRNTMIMYFSPDCDHCKHQTDSMFAHFNDFREVEILMATYQPFDEMKKFYRAYEMGKYANIK
ncbi:MAG TPA: hypothetical protein VM187_09570, partial [Niastella sp.]|nr:hypothetical protein [Niastella sp.]